MSRTGESRVSGGTHRFYHAAGTPIARGRPYDGPMLRRTLPAMAILALALVACDDPAPLRGSTSSSPAIVAVDGVDGMPTTVAELPNADATAFRSLLGELRGTPVVVNLWASWCEPCTREMPLLALAAADHRDVQFLGVDTLDSRGGAEDFIAEHGVPFPSLFDPDGAIRTDLAGNGLPITVFFDAEGNQVAKVDGELSREVLDEQLGAVAS